MRIYALVGIVSLAAGCAATQSGAEGPRATADVKPFEGQKASGQARFSEAPDGTLRVEVQAKGLTPGQHGMHVHTVGDCSAPPASGGHVDPFDTKQHGRPDQPDTEAHAGDMPMLVADANGNATLTWQTRKMTLSPGKLSVVGRAIVIHQDPDDYKTNPAGNTGPRIACGVITAQR